MLPDDVMTWVQHWHQPVSQHVNHILHIKQIFAPDPYNISIMSVNVYLIDITEMQE